MLKRIAGNAIRSSSRVHKRVSKFTSGRSKRSNAAKLGQCRVVIVERRPLLREGLMRIIASKRFRIAATLASVDDIGAMSLPQNIPLLIVLGSREDEPATTAQEIKAFRLRYPDAHIAVVAENDEADNVLSAFRAGADAYLAKLTCQNTLIKSLELVVAGERLLTSAMLSRILGLFQERSRSVDLATCSAMNEGVEIPPASEGGNVPRLSVQERIILRQLVDGNSNKIIARAIGVSEATVKVHVKSILRKIRVLNRTQAAIWASRHGYNWKPADATPGETLGLEMS